METQLAVAKHRHEAVSIFDNAERFDHYQRVAKAFASSELVPQQFRGNIANTLIALDMADRLKANPMAVMQSIYVVHGKPSWAATFIIAQINASGKFSPLRFDIRGTGDAKTCVAWVKELESGERIEGPEVSVQMSKAEGWYDRNGSKWKTMPDLMLRYRAATLFGRLYCPELLMGMKTEDEQADVIDVTPARSRPTADAFVPAFEAPPKENESAAAEPPPAQPEKETVTTPPEPQAQAANEPATPQEELSEFLTSSGVSFDDFRDWLKSTGRMTDVDSLGGFNDVPTTVCQALRRDAKSLAKCVTLYGKKD